MKPGCLPLSLFLLAFAVSAQEPEPQRSEPMVRIRGRVLDAAGQPLATAGVLIGPVDGVTTAKALSQPDARCAIDGTFSLAIAQAKADKSVPTMLLIAAPQKVALRVPNLEFLDRTKAVRNECALDLGDIRLPDGFTLSGRVRGQDGKAIAGARIRAADRLCIYPWACPHFGSQAVTGEKGVFTLPGVFATAMAIAVEADGYYCKRIVSIDLGQPLDLQLEASGFIEGTVLDAQARAFAGPVRVTYEVFGMESQLLRTEQGRFRLGLTVPCRLKIQAFDPATWQWAESPMLQGPTNGVALRFAAPGEQSLVVRAVADTSGKPIERFRAAAFWSGEVLDASIEQWLRLSVLDSGTDGGVRLQPQPSQGGGKCVVHVAADGMAPLFVEHVEWKAGEDFVARLVPESRIEGRVVDAATGDPAAGMRVACTRLTNESADHEAMRYQPATTITAADGAFVLPELARGTYELEIRRPVGTVFAMHQLTLGAAEVRNKVEVSLPIGVSVTGTIKGAAPGWKVLLLHDDDPPASNPQFPGGGELDAWNLAGAEPVIDGSFRFEHRASRTEQLSLVIPLPPRHGGALRIPVAVVRIGLEDVVLDVDLTQHVPGVVTGKVTTLGAEVPKGRLAVVTIRLGEANEDRIGHEEQLRRRHWALVGVDGTFEVPAIPGQHVVEVIDVVTGVVLLSGDPIEVVSGEQTRKDLQVSVVEANVLCEAENGGLLQAQRLEIDLGAERSNGLQLTLFADGALGGFGPPGIDLVGVDGSIRCFVPPGRVTVRVPAPAMWTGGSAGTFDWNSGGPCAESTFEAELGKVSKVVVKVPPLADIHRK